MNLKVKFRQRTGWAFSLLALLLALSLISGRSALHSFAASCTPKLALFENSAFAETPEISARAELEKLQRQSGLSIGIFSYKGIGLLLFRESSFAFRKLLFDGNSTNGTVSRDGTEIALLQPMSKPSSVVVVHPDGSDLRDYTGIPRPAPMCWSYDNSKLVVGIAGGQIRVLDLKSRLIQQIPTEGSSRVSLVTSQCWSPSGGEIVFESSDGEVFVYDVGKENPVRLTKGTEPTWSPDGSWIAYRDGDTYYAIHPSGEGKRKIFHRTRAVSGLYWSPDSRFVAYVHEDFFALDTEFYHLVVRRLEDNSEDRVADGEDANCCAGYQWVVNKELLAEVQSATKPN